MLQQNSDIVALPHLDLSEAQPEDKEIYLRFMGHLRHVPVSRMEIKILSSIQFTADIMNSSDAHIAKTLVEMGLRAPRIAFPVAFLDYIDHALLRKGWHIGTPSIAMTELKEIWRDMASQPPTNADFSSFRHVHNIVHEDILSQ